MNYVIITSSHIHLQWSYVKLVSEKCRGIAVRSFFHTVKNLSTLRVKLLMHVADLGHAMHLAYLFAYHAAV